MNKIARFSALAVVLAASVGTTAFAATSTVTGGYAQSDMQVKRTKQAVSTLSTATSKTTTRWVLSVLSPTPKRSF